MKKLILAILLFVAPIAFAQQGTTTKIRNGATLPTTCGGGDIFIKSGSSEGFYFNIAPGTCSWSAIVANPTIYKECGIDIGGNNGSALTDADISPQITSCQFPSASTVIEIDVRADGGTPNVIVSKNHAGTQTALLSAALATAAAGGRACSKTTAIAGIDGTTCSSTLQNNSLAAGDYIDVTGGTAGGTAKHLIVVIHATVP